MDEYGVPEIDEKKIGERLGELFLIACLYHDIGKLVTKEEDGYKGHAEAGARYFKEKIASQIGLTEEEAIIVAKLIEEHLDTFDYLRNGGDRATEPVENIGIVDLIACYMEHYFNIGDIAIPKKYVTPDLKKLRGVKDTKNYHVKDMLTHSLITYHVAEMLTRDRCLEDEIDSVLVKSGGTRGPTTGYR